MRAFRLGVLVAVLASAACGKLAETDLVPDAGGGPFDAAVTAPPPVDAHVSPKDATRPVDAGADATLDAQREVGTVEPDASPFFDATGVPETGVPSDSGDASDAPPFTSWCAQQATPYYFCNDFDVPHDISTPWETTIVSDGGDSVGKEFHIAVSGPFAGTAEINAPADGGLVTAEYEGELWHDARPYPPTLTCEFSIYPENLMVEDTVGIFGIVASTPADGGFVEDYVLRLLTAADGTLALTERATDGTVQFQSIGGAVSSRAWNAVVLTLSTNDPMNPGATTVSLALGGEPQGTTTFNLPGPPEVALDVLIGLNAASTDGHVETFGALYDNVLCH